MSITIMAKVLHTRYKGRVSYVEKTGKLIKISGPSAKLTMLAISDSADDFGENSYNSFDTLSLKTDLERRSVIRVVRGLLAQGYISVSGLSTYGTNDFKVNLDKLGTLPTRRARTGRPKSSDVESLLIDEKAKSSDSESKSSDSETESSDVESPYPSLSLIKPVSAKSPEKPAEKKGNKRILGTQAAPSVKKGTPLDWLLQSDEQLVYQKSVQELHERFERASGLNPKWDSVKDGWADFTNYLLDKDAKGETIEKFYAWFNADQFRRESNMWMKPEKYELWWNQAFTYSKPESIKIKAEPTPFELAFLRRQGGQ
jgi:hypothetical protein